MRKVLSKVGQSTLEYVIVLTAIVAAILFAAAQFMKPAVNNVFSQAGGAMTRQALFMENKVGAAVNLYAPGGTTTASTTTASTTTASTTTATTMR